MEPMDSGKNDENNVYSSSRRISSILKVPRKSIIFQDPEQRENEVQCAKPSEKRNSRRVSFAPANDVLLFSKDEKNASSLQSPFQALMSTENPMQKSVQVLIGEDRIQQIKAAFGNRYDKGNTEDTLQITDTISFKNQSSHASEQQMYNLKQQCTENTKSTADDTCMDITQSYTVKIMDELSSSSTPNLGISFNGGKTDISQSSTERKHEETAAQPVSSDISLDPKFKQFLASVFKPECQRVISGDARMSQIKEAIEQPKEDLSKVITRFQKGGLLGNTGTYETLQYPLLEQKMQPQVGQTKFQQLCSDRQRSSYVTGNGTPSKVKHQINSSTQEDCREQSVRFAVDKAHLDNTQSHSVNMAPVFTMHSRSDERTVKFSANNATIDVTQNLNVNIDAPFDASSKQRAHKRVSAKDAAMDMTQSLNAAIVSGTHANVNSLTAGGEKTIRFLENDTVMDMTQGLTVMIYAPVEPEAQNIVNSAERDNSIGCSVNDVPMVMDQKLTSIIDTHYEPEADRHLHSVSGKGEKTTYDAAMDITQSLIAVNDTPFEGGDHKNVHSEPAREEKTHRFSANYTAMDFTQNLTANIATHLEPGPHHNGNFLPVGGENTAALDVTRSLTTTIDTHFEPKQHQVVNFALAGREKTVINSANGTAKDITANMVANLEPGTNQNCNFLPAEKENTIRFSPNDAAVDVRRSLATKNDTPFEPKEHQNEVNFITTGKETITRNLVKDRGMDVTRNLTENIDKHLRPRAYQNGSVVANGVKKTIKFSANDDLTDLTQNVDAPFEREAHQNVHFAPVGGEKTMCFSGNDAALDVTRSLTTIIDTNFEPKHNQSVNFTTAGREETVRNSDNDTAKDVSRNLTANIATHLEPGPHHNGNFLPAGGENTAALDVTRSLTTTIETHFEPKQLQIVNFAPAGREKTVINSANGTVEDVKRDMAANLEPGTYQNCNVLPTRKENTIRFSTNDTVMDVSGSLTTKNGTSFEPKEHQNIVNFIPTGKETSIRNLVEDGEIDLTRNLTENIADHLRPGAYQNGNFVPPVVEKTIRFSTNDISMDLTQSIDAAFEHFTPAGEEKMLCFSTNDAVMATRQRIPPHIISRLEPGVNDNEPNRAEKTMRFSPNDVTQNHITNIDEYLEPASHQDVDLKPNVIEQSMKYTENDAMEVTQSDTINAAHPQQNTECLTSEGEKTTRQLQCSTNDVSMDMTRSHTVNITDDLLSSGVPLAKKQGELRGLQRKTSLSILNFNPGQIHRMFTKTDPTAEPSFEETVETKNLISAQSKTINEDSKYNIPGVETPCSSPLSKMKKMDDSLKVAESDVSLKPEEIETGCIFGVGCSNEPPQFDTSTQHNYTDVQENREVTSQKTSQELALSYQDVVEKPDALGSKEEENRKEAAYGNETSPLPQKLDSPNSGQNGRDSKISRRVSLVELQSKLRRLKCRTSETFASDICTAPLPDLDSDANRNTKDCNVIVPEEVPDVKTGLENTQDEHTQYEVKEKTTVPTPFKTKTTELRSRLSVGAFTPKLPQRSRTNELQNAESSYNHSQEKSGYIAAIDNITNKLNKWNDIDASDINDEELGSCEDLSETLDIKSPLGISDVRIPYQKFNIDENLQENVFQENSPVGAKGIKRRLPSDENNTEDEKKMKASDQVSHEAVETTNIQEYDGVNVTSLPTMSNQVMDSSSTTHTNSTHSDCSTFKHSVFESQFEDSDVKKLEDGTLTVMEFFKLFGIDFVIHKPRQSINPGNLSHDTGCSPMAVLKNRHINHPKQMVYEADLENLSEKVEGLYSKMMHLNKPLKDINKHLWEELKKSSEKEISSFGVKLKERNNFFRRISKVRSHEMKEVLYSNLLQTTTDEQEKLSSTIAESEEMIKILDGCIGDLEAELEAVEEKGTEKKPSIKSLQEDIKNLNGTLDDKKRQIYELEVQTKQASKKLDILKAETKHLQGFVGMLNIVNEWRFKEKTDNCTVYTFLNDTLQLQLVHEGNCADNEPERKMSHINFKFLLDDEKSQDHARLVHKLLSQYIEAETAWVEKYPTFRYVPKLLHDVSLVVSHCRLLGEELRLMKMWGGLRLNIEDISCVDSRINIIFSSLKRVSKFEVTFSVSLVNHLYGLHLQVFKNFFGDTTARQIEQIVESFSPAKKLLTKIVKKINCDLLC
ncbi:kinetochore scaffold 1 isoform X2 [Corythoichthys intestinalis]|uniref:kinetochore scaffold 1 isoform X2 n=1 Tax=Corythoichthys intestinalis TaxID=161448 RepID=UPI0025A64A11|nr:kinetochore scaffold 1 isoform X2 [Corythoichthys intestinalis]